MPKPHTSLRLSLLGQQQLADLRARWGMNQNEVIAIALDRAWRELNHGEPNARIGSHALDDVREDGTPPVG
jgi:hypothetical protein